MAKTTVRSIRRMPARRWRARPGDWAALAVLFGVGAAALLARGPLGRAQAASPDGRLVVEYRPVDQRGARAALVVRVAAEEATDGRLRLRLNRSYLRSVRIAEVQPEPDRVETGQGDAVFVFRLEDTGRPATVRFLVEGLELGKVEGRLAVVGGPMVGFTQFVLP